MHTQTQARTFFPSHTPSLSVIHMHAVTPTSYNTNACARAHTHTISYEISTRTCAHTDTHALTVHTEFVIPTDDVAGCEGRTPPSHIKCTSTKHQPLEEPSGLLPDKSLEHLLVLAPPCVPTLRPLGFTHVWLTLIIKSHTRVFYLGHGCFCLFAFLKVGGRVRLKLFWLEFENSTKRVCNTFSEG